MLTHLGLRPQVQRRLVLGDNISQAAQFTLCGSVEAGLVVLLLVRSPAFSGRGSCALIPAVWHSPLRQRMVLTRGSGKTARRFYQYLRTSSARAILERYGFVLPSP